MALPEEEWRGDYRGVEKRLSGDRWGKDPVRRKDYDPWSF